MTFTDLFTDIIALALWVAGDMVIILSGLLIVLAVVAAVISALQPLRR
jgi:hypothetical protein